MDFFHPLPIIDKYLVLMADTEKITHNETVKGIHTLFRIRRLLIPCISIWPLHGQCSGPKNLYKINRFLSPLLHGPLQPLHPWCSGLNNCLLSYLNNCIYCVLMPMQSVDGEHHEKAVELLKAAQGSVKLVVRYTPKVLEEMEARFEKMRSARRRQHTSYS